MIEKSLFRVTFRDEERSETFRLRFVAMDIEGALRMANEYMQSRSAILTIYMIEDCGETYV